MSQKLKTIFKIRKTYANTYTIAEFLAQKTINQNEAKLLSKLTKLSDNDDPLTYAYLSALKYVAWTKPDLLAMISWTLT